MGYTGNIVIDANGGGNVSLFWSSFDGLLNLDVKKYVNSNGTWILVDSISAGNVTWYTGDLMEFETKSTQGNNPCGINSGRDLITGGDDDGNGINNLLCIFQTVLPVTWLSSPTATIKNKFSQISWSVASQVNNSHFIIEHSSDGKSYSEIGKVHGHGNTSETKHYTYIHETPSIGINYYRIKQVDYDGQSSYSDVASVVYESDGGDVRIYPNPASSEVTISTTEPTSVQVMDMYGRVLINQDISEGQNTLEISELPSGILIFVVGDQRFKVLKE